MVNIFLTDFLVISFNYQNWVMQCHFLVNFPQGTMLTFGKAINHDIENTTNVLLFKIFSSLD